MPRQQLQIPTAAPVRATLPTKQFPWLKSIINELDFPCATCSSAFGQPVHVPFMDAVKDPIRGPQHYTTVFAVLCPDCRTAPQDGPFITMGMVDLLSVPQNYKKPRRSTTGSNESGLSMDEEEEVDVEEDEAPVKRQRTLQTKKKTSDLNPASRGKKAKGAVKAASKKVKNGDLAI